MNDKELPSRPPLPDWLQELEASLGVDDLEDELEPGEWMTAYAVRVGVIPTQTGPFAELWPQEVFLEEETLSVQS